MLKFALRNLMSRPLRSLLALLGLTVAIAGMVGLFSIAHGIDRMVSRTFGRIPGLVVLQPGAPIPLFSSLPAAWEDDLAAVPGVGVVNAEVWQRVNLIDGKMIVSPPRFLFGTDIETRLRLRHCVYREELVAGRYLTLADRGTFNILVSRAIAEEFDKGVGDVLRVNGQEMTIVGVYHTGSLLLDVALMLDIDQVRGLTRFDPGSVSVFYVEQTGEMDDEELIERIQSRFRGRTVEPWRPPSLDPIRELPGGWFLDLLRQLLDTGSPETDGAAFCDGLPDENRKAATSRRTSQQSPRTVNGVAVPAAETEMPADGAGVPSDEDDDLPIEVRSAVEWAERFDRFSDDLNIFLTLMTGIGVTIAILSIVNTMLMSVSERIIEFGILKANGWSPFDVMRLITWESGALGAGGGLLGSVLGWTATHVVNWYWPERVDLYAGPGLLLFAVAFSTLLGVLGGLYPAIWAMRMMPMDAIRRG